MLNIKTCIPKSNRAHLQHLSLPSAPYPCFPGLAQLSCLSLRPSAGMTNFGAEVYPERLDGDGEDDREEVGKHADCWGVIVGFVVVGKTEWIAESNSDTEATRYLTVEPRKLTDDMISKTCVSRSIPCHPPRAPRCTPPSMKMKGECPGYRTRP